jgi:hypothetical protein
LPTFRLDPEEDFGANLDRKRDGHPSLNELIRRLPGARMLAWLGFWASGLPGRKSNRNREEGVYEPYSTNSKLPNLPT